MRGAGAERLRGVTAPKACRRVSVCAEGADAPPPLRGGTPLRHASRATSPQGEALGADACEGLPFRRLPAGSRSVQSRLNARLRNSVRGLTAPLLCDSGRLGTIYPRKALPITTGGVAYRLFLWRFPKGATPPFGTRLCEAKCSVLYALSALP